MYGKTVEFARQEWNGTQRGITMVEGALQVSTVTALCPPVAKPRNVSSMPACAQTSTVTHSRLDPHGFQLEDPGLSVLQNITGDVNATVVDFKSSALNDLRPAWEDVQRAADSFADNTVPVADKSTNGVLYFGNETWTSLQGAGAPALAPMAAPKVFRLFLTHAKAWAGPVETAGCQEIGRPTPLGFDRTLRLSSRFPAGIKRACIAFIVLHAGSMQVPEAVSSAASQSCRQRSP